MPQRRQCDFVLVHFFGQPFCSRSCAVKTPGHAERMPNVALGMPSAPNALGMQTNRGDSSEVAVAVGVLDAERLEDRKLRLRSPTQSDFHIRVGLVPWKGPPVPSRDVHELKLVSQACAKEVDGLRTTVTRLARLRRAAYDDPPLHAECRREEGARHASAPHRRVDRRELLHI